MWFKNLQIYRLPVPWNLSTAELEEQLARKQFQPCSSQTPSSAGWIPAFEEDSLVHRVGAQCLLTLCTEQRLLPTAIIRQETSERAENLATTQGFRPGRKQMKDLQEQVTQELLPRAFSLRKHMRAWIDPLNGWLLVDAPSQNRAETLLETLRDSLDNLPLSLLRTEYSPVSAMSGWLAADEAPAGFSIDQECELSAPSEGKATVRYLRHTLDGDEIRKHLAAGKLPTRLALTYDDRISFILSDKLELKRLAFLDVVQEQLDSASQEDRRAVFDASFSLMCAELCRLLPALVEALGGASGETLTSTS